MNKAVFCGTFDPFTLGHLDILKKAGGIFDKIFVAVPANNGKDTRTTLESRIKIARTSIEKIPFAEVVSFSGALTDFCKTIGVFNLIRGLRNAADFVYENDLLRNYQSQNPSIECTYFFPDAKFSHISSTVVRELVRIGGNIENHICKSAMTLVLDAYKAII